MKSFISLLISEISDLKLSGQVASKITKSTDFSQCVVMFKIPLFSIECCAPNICLFFDDFVLRTNLYELSYLLY